MEFVKKEKEIFESYIFVCSTIASILGKTRKNKTKIKTMQKQQPKNK